MNNGIVEDQHTRAMREGLPWVDPDRAVFILVRKMLEDCWRTTKSESLKERAAQGYERLVGAPIKNFARSATTFSSPYLVGPPGHGKSSVAAEACRRFSDLVGLNFHEDVPEGNALTSDDCVLIAREMTGEQSTLATRGIYDKVKYFDRDVTSRVPYKEFVAARDAAYSMIVFEDIASALEPVKTSMLGLLRRRYSEGEDFRSSMFVLTGNIGEADGTWTTNDGSALTGRVEKLYLEDEVQLFARRLQRKFDDDLADGMVGAFLVDHTECFSPPVNADVQNKPWPSPRTWEEVARNMRVVLNAFRHNPSSPMFKQDFVSGSGLAHEIELASAPVGRAVGAVFCAYAESYISDTYPMAEAIMKAGPLESKELLLEVARRAGKGVGVTDGKSQMSFQQQYAEACGAICASRIAARPEMHRNSGADAKQKADAVGEEIARYMLAMNLPYVYSDGAGFIPQAVQGTATWMLGNRLGSIPSLSGPLTESERAMGRKRMDLVIARLATVSAIESLNEVTTRIAGKAMFGQADAYTKFFGPLTGSPGTSKKLGLPSFSDGPAPSA